MGLNNYPLEELEVLLKCIRMGAVYLTVDKMDIIVKWSDRVEDAISDAKFNDKQLNF